MCTFKRFKKKYGKRSARIKEGDTASIIRGEFAGVDGKVTKISVADRGVNIEGVKKRNSKAKNLMFMFIQQILF